MILMGLSGFGGSFHGLGAVDAFGFDWATCASQVVDPTGTTVECLDANGNSLASKPVGNQTATTTSSSSSSNPWWSTALTALVKGTAQGVLSPSGAVLPSCAVVPAGTPCIPVVAVPWYQTPTGMIGIAIAALGVGYLFLKK